MRTILVAFALCAAAAFAVGTAAVPDTVRVNPAVGTEQDPVRPGNGVSYPRVVHEVKPQYTADAMRTKIQGRVELECVVDTDGSVGDVKVVQSLDAKHGLDDEAIKSAKQWRFVPGSRNGEPVPVVIRIEMVFTTGKHKRFR
jgi:protein TonB